MTTYQTYYNLFVSSIALNHRARSETRQRARTHHERILQLLQVQVNQYEKDSA